MSHPCSQLDAPITRGHEDGESVRPEKWNHHIPFQFTSDELRRIEHQAPPVEQLSKLFSLPEDILLTE